MQLVITLLGPVTWIGLLTGWFWHQRRLAHERKIFKSAIDRRATDLWAQVIGGLGAAILLSLVAIAAGLVLPSVFLWVVAGLTVVALLSSGLGFAPWFLGLLGLLGWALPQATSLFGPGGTATTWGWRVALLVAGAWGLNALLLLVLDPPNDVPTIKPGKRGAPIVVYAHRQFYWLPLVLPVPGSWFAALPWWPTLGVGTHQFALIGLPLVLGAAVRTAKQLPETALRQWAFQYGLSSAIALAVAVWSWTLPQWAWVLQVALAIWALILGLWNRAASRHGASYISRTTTGVRLVAVRPDTPAATMGLKAGDIVLECNQLPVHTASELYAAIQTRPTFCRLRVRRLDGALKLVETAIYQDAPHELGMITFAEDEA